MNFFSYMQFFSCDSLSYVWSIEKNYVIILSEKNADFHLQSIEDYAVAQELHYDINICWRRPLLLLGWVTGSFYCFIPI
ncbi:hypothetical protein T4C_12771, partial [Trichinella pseudospiralis]